MEAALAERPAATAGLEDLLAVLRRRHDAMPFVGWPVRAARLQAVERLLQTRGADIAAAISADFGHRPRQETDLLEIFPLLEALRHAQRHGRSWMAERRVGVAPWFRPAVAWVLPQPLGVIGIVVPWNYPLYLLLGPLVGALAAGNLAMAKLSEFTPRFGSLMADLLAEALGDDVVRVVNGGPEIAAEFSALPFDHLVFTGSTAVGRRVMAAAAKNLVPVTLELGGKSPAVITAATFAQGSRFAHAVRRIVAGKALNAGQTCIATDYVLLPRAAIGPFVEIARETLGKLYPDGAASADYAGIASDRHFERLQAMLAEAAGRGAAATTVMPAAASGQRKLPLTLLAGCPNEVAAMQEEIFGPVLPLVACESVDEAAAFIGRRPRPLAAYLFDDNRAVQQRFLRSTIAGGVSINETLLHIAQDGLPFGGVGASGMGHYHGRYGFDALSKLKPVFRQSRFNGAEWLAPPYGPMFERFLRLMLRR